MRDPMKKEKKKKDEISSVHILEISIQCVVVDVHIDQALQKRKQFKVKCINIFVLKY